MQCTQSSPSLLLIILVSITLSALSAAHPRHNNNHGHTLAGRDTVASSVILPVNAMKTGLFVSPAVPCSGSGCTIASSPTRLPCDAANGTLLSHELQNYTMICDIDFPGQNIYPFISANSFEACMDRCHDHNEKNIASSHCAGFVFAPERVGKGDDCYLKSSLNQPASATIHLVGATVVPATEPCASNSCSDSMISSHPGQGSIGELRVVDFRVLGASKNKPTTKYVHHPLVSPQKLAKDLLVPGVNTDLISGYPIAGDTGSWSERETPLDLSLADLKVAPHMSRDGGRGGTINGTHIFVFCDTANFAIDPTFGTIEMVGFVSSSVATDDGMNALYGKPLDLVDHIGEWQDDVGRMRGFAPMTTGEQSFNIDLSGEGYRYAVWPESSLIPLNASHSILYPALVYDVVDMKTQEFVLHALGNSVLLIHVDPTYGPVAQRIVKQLFQADQVTFGTLGGIRAWGPSGEGRNDGYIYLFGKASSGVQVARVAAGEFADLPAFDYWSGDSWVREIPAEDSNDLLIDIPIMCLDVFYVPATRRFMLVYLNTFADNTFYYRTLPSDVAVEPPYDRRPGTNPDPFYVEKILTRPWSEEKVLARIPTPAQGFVYAGGIQEGYFGEQDITKGGMKILITWTEHTGKDGTDPESGYAHMSGIVVMELQ